MKNGRLSVEEAATLLNASPQFIRTGLQQNAFPWGYEVKTSSQYTYLIMQKKFEECTGIKVSEENLNQFDTKEKKN